jgi:amidase
VARNFFGSNPSGYGDRSALQDLAAQGATLVDTEVPNVGKYGQRN